MFIPLLKFMRNISKHRFSGRGVLNSVMDIYSMRGAAPFTSTSIQNWMDLDVKGAAFKTFHFAEVINE